MIFSKKTRKIDFLVCGTQKGGTTALDHYLRKHPEIGMGKKRNYIFLIMRSSFQNHQRIIQHMRICLTLMVMKKHLVK
jgi:hypothetical protein